MDKDEISAFEERLALRAASVESLLAQVLGEMPLPGEIHRPQRLMAAMRHGALGGGKRLRPFLVIESAILFDGRPEEVLQAAAALECIHCYSLIHDDLPAMDDDDTRRGLPTVHRAFDEATAILAGDSLLTLAFDLASDPACHADPAVRAELVSMLARASGAGGMAGGQMLDLEGEGRRRSEAQIRKMQSMKTGALIRVACEAGALLGGADGKDRRALAEYGRIAGELFQLADDLLDVTASAEAMGKATGKDARKGKATLVAMHGVVAATRRADALVRQACETLGDLGEGAGILRDCVRYMAARGR